MMRQMVKLSRGYAQSVSDLPDQYLSLVIAGTSSLCRDAGIIDMLSRLNQAREKLQLIYVCTKQRPLNTVASWVSSFKDFKVIHLDTEDVARKHQVGLRFSSGNIVWFLNAQHDVHYRQDLINYILELHRCYGDQLGLGGFYELAPHATAKAQALYLIKKNFYQHKLTGISAHCGLICDNASYKRQQLLDQKSSISDLFNEQPNANLKAKFRFDTTLNVIIPAHITLKQFLHDAIQKGQHDSASSYSALKKLQAPSLLVSAFIALYKVSYLLRHYTKGPKTSPGLITPTYVLNSISHRLFYLRLNLSRTSSPLKLPQGLIDFLYFIRNTTAKPFIKVYFVTLYHYQTYFLPLIKGTYFVPKKRKKRANS